MSESTKDSELTLDSVRNCYKALCDGESEKDPSIKCQYCNKENPFHLIQPFRTCGWCGKEAYNIKKVSKD